jgi:hypothetical protein
MMKHILFILFLILMIILPATSYAMGSYASMPSEKPVINRVIGDVNVKTSKSNSWQDGKKGMLLNSGDTIKTGSDGKCEIFHAGGAIRLYGNTVLIVPALESKEDAVAIKRVQMEHGAGIFRTSPLGIDDGFEVQTLHVIAGVKGTIFSVLNVENGTTVSVYRGQVLATDTDGTPATETKLGSGNRMIVKNGVGFGVIIYFEPWDAWGGWRHDSEPPAKDPKANPLNNREGESEYGDSGPTN